MARLQRAEHMMANKSKRTAARIPGEVDGTASEQTSQIGATKSGAMMRAISSDNKEAHSQPRKSKIDQLIALLRRQKGATVAQLAEALGWQQHSVRGAMSGALRKRGLAVESDKMKGQRLYRLAG